MLRVEKTSLNPSRAQIELEGYFWKPDSEWVNKIHLLWDIYVQMSENLRINGQNI